MNKYNKKKIQFVQIYYENMDKLEIDFEGCMIIEYLRFQSKNRDEIGKINKSEISKDLKMSRTTFYKKFNNLTFLKIDDGKFYFVENFLEEYELGKKGKFIIIYLEYWNQLKINLSSYLFLYLTYSLSLKYKYYCFFSHTFFSEKLQVNTSTIYQIRNELLQKGVIESVGLQLFLAESIFGKFEELKTSYEK